MMTSDNKFQIPFVISLTYVMNNKWTTTNVLNFDALYSYTYFNLVWRTFMYFFLFDLYEIKQCSDNFSDV